MDGGLSWADQWDYNTPDPPPPPKDEDKKGKDSKNKSGVKKMSLKWFKGLGKKTNK
ncbi:hypothetical protein AQUCO_01100302v1 [Aquilegia coerulea]|uniref:Uncharacterized protein n=1 Tax=Aquilegia coerulea TaxID=218851 RepID=A0A2G5E6Q8_AQUCA|nr:hypothetical protein AQUCO_01100302v1 [Aquilegia coerulea]